MKKIILYIVLLSLPGGLFSQSAHVKKIQKIRLEEKAYFPKFGRDRNEILLSGLNYDGLSLYHSKSKKIDLVSANPGSGSEPGISEDGKIHFSETRITKGKKIIDYKTFDPETGSITAAENPFQQKKIKPEGKTIRIYENNTSRTISPAGEKYYLWTSLSPDGQKILFTAAGDGCYISDLQGNILFKAGYLNAPVWMGNNWITGMDDRDDGEKIISSDIIAIHIPSGKRFNLTEKSGLIAQYPDVSPETNRIVFHDASGGIYLMKLRIKE